MASLLVVSAGPAGKTAVCAAIGRKLIEKGKRVGYWRPVVLTADGAPDYQDAITMREALGLSEAPQLLSPVHLSEKQFEQAQGLEETIRTAFTAVAAGRDVLMTEGLSAVDNASGKFDVLLADLMDAKVVMVVRYTPSISGAGVARVSKAFGPRCLGVIVTAVPRARPGRAAPDVRAIMAKDGVVVLGVIPEDRTLFGISVFELVRLLDARVVSGQDLLDGTIENLMLGAMTVDSGLDYFNRKDHKAVIVRGDRPDMALAALQTDTVCLVLTGGVEPPPVVVRTAGDRKVPVLLTGLETPNVVELIEQAIPGAKFRGTRKIDRMDDLVTGTVDLDGIFRALGV